MVKHTQTIRRQIADELFECVFDHFAGLALKGLTVTGLFKQNNEQHYDLRNNSQFTIRPIRTV